MSLCGGNLTVWGLLNQVAGAKDQATVLGLEWTYLRHVDSWEFTRDLQEATRKRTSSTNGLAVKFCPDTVSFDVEVTNTICPNEQWLYGAILANPSNIGVGVTAWWFLGFDVKNNPGNNGSAVAPAGTAIAPGGAATSTSLFTNGAENSSFQNPDNGYYVYGTVVPPGFGAQNDGQDPATGDWSITATRIIAPSPAFDADTDAVWTVPDAA